MATLTEIPLNIPVPHQFVPSTSGTGIPSSMKVYGPSLAIVKTTNTYGFAQDVNGGPGWTCSFLPDQLGVWSVVILDSGGVVLHSTQYNCVSSTTADRTLNLESKYHGVVDIMPHFFQLQNSAKQITAISISGTTVTATTASAHGYSVGNRFIIAGVNPQGYNTYGSTTSIATIPTSTTFTYTVATSVATAINGVAGAAITPAFRGGSHMTVTKLYDNQHAVSPATFTYMSLVSTAKNVIPQTGYIYGITFTGTANIPNFTSFRFFTCTPDGNYVVRGISEDFHATTPVEGAWGSSNTIWFKNPVPANVGDYWGYTVVAPSGHTSDAFTSYSDIMTVPALTQELKIRGSNASDLALGGATNVFTTYGAGTHGMFNLQMFMAPPKIVLAGHSFYSGFSDADVASCSTYDYNTGGAALPFNAGIDIAAAIEAYLGVPVINCAVGGSSIFDWVGQPTYYGINSNSTGAGWFEQFVAPLNPSLMLFDTAYNDANTSITITTPQYYTYLDRLLRHCDKYAIELVMMEGAPSWATTQDVVGSNRTANYNRLRDAVRTWCQQNNVPLIPTYYRMGQNALTPAEPDIPMNAELPWQRWRMKDGDEFNYLPNYQGGADVTHYIHLQTPGKMALAALLSQGIRLRTKPTPFFGLNKPDSATLVQPFLVNPQAINFLKP